MIDEDREQLLEQNRAFCRGMAKVPAISRVWAMPSRNTFEIPPIAGFVQKYLLKSQASVDPFARNKRWATYTNDLNPNTAAEYHLEAREFLLQLLGWGVLADLVIFDPPYNPSQAKECYESIGLKNTLKSAQSGGVWAEEKTLAARLLVPGEGVFLWFGWNTCGMGKGRGFEISEILIVSHGRGKNDTFCLAETKMPPHPDLFEQSLAKIASQGWAHTHSKVENRGAGTNPAPKI